jgi:hypothetical protein
MILPGIESDPIREVGRICATQDATGSGLSRSVREKQRLVNRPRAVRGKVD